jgi:hypothetical protein
MSEFCCNAHETFSNPRHDASAKEFNRHDEKFSLTERHSLSRSHFEVTAFILTDILLVRNLVKLIIYKNKMLCFTSSVQEEENADLRWCFSLVVKNL